MIVLCYTLGALNTVSSQLIQAGTSPDLKPFSTSAQPRSTELVPLLSQPEPQHRDKVSLDNAAASKLNVNHVFHYWMESYCCDYPIISKCYVELILWSCEIRFVLIVLDNLDISLQFLVAGLQQQYFVYRNPTLFHGLLLESNR